MERERVGKEEGRQGGREGDREEGMEEGREGGRHKPLQAPQLLLSGNADISGQGLGFEAIGQLRHVVLLEKKSKGRE